MFLLDTNIVIHLRDGTPDVLAKAASRNGAMAMSALSLAELQQGLYRSPELWAYRKPRTDTLLRTISVLPFDTKAAEAYGTIIASIGWARNRVFDRMIAAHAISVGRTLVTANVADFADIPGLVMENWADVNA